MRNRRPDWLTSCGGGAAWVARIVALLIFAALWISPTVAAAAEPSAVFEVREESFLNFERGVMRRDIFIHVIVHRGELGALTLSMPTGVDVNLLQARYEQPDRNLVQDWRVEESPAGAFVRKINVRFKAQLNRPFCLHIRADQAFEESAHAVSMLPFVVEDADSQWGLIVAIPELPGTLAEAGSTGIKQVTKRDIEKYIGVGSATGYLAFRYVQLPAELKMRLGSGAAVAAAPEKAQVVPVERPAQVAQPVENAPAAGGVSVSEAEYSVRVDGKFATVTAKLSVLVPGGGWSSLALLPESAVLRSCEVSGKRGYVQRADGHYTAQMMGEGKYAVALTFILDVQEQGPERSITLPLVRSAGGRVLLDLDWPDLAVRLTPEAPMELAREAGRTRATVVPGGAEAMTVRWMPEELAKARAPVFEARETNVVSIEPGVVKRESHVMVAVQRGELNALTVAVPDGVDVVGLSAYVAEDSGNAKPLLDWRIEEPAGAGGLRKIHARLARPITAGITLKINSEQVFDPSAGGMSLKPFVLEGASRQYGVFGVAGPKDLTLAEANSMGVRRASEAPVTGFVHLPQSDLIFEYAKLPAELKLKTEVIPARITAVTASRVKLQAGVVELTEQITHHVENAPVGRFHIGLSEGLIVLGVAGEGVETWEVKGGIVEVRLKRPVLGDHVLTVRCIENLKRVNGTLIPSLRCADAERESGSIGIIAAPDLALQHHRAEKVVQVDVARLPDWVREAGPKLGYIYDQPGGMLSVETSVITPVVRVQGLGVAVVGEEAIQEEYVFDCDISRKPVFNLLVDLPNELTVLNLVGPDVQDWEFHEGQPVLTVTFSRALLGKTQLHLFCERRTVFTAESAENAEKESNKAEANPLPSSATPPDEGRASSASSAVRTSSADEPRALKITPLGGVFIRGAEQYSGWFAVATDANLDLKTLESHSMTAADVKDAPPLLQAYGHLMLGFRWTGDDWGVTCDAIPIAPRIEAKTRTALLFDAGVMRTITDVTWRISKATVRDLSIRLPPKTLSSAVIGKNIRSRELVRQTEGGQVGDTWHIRLDDPVKGDYSLRVAYEQLPDSAGQIAYTGIRLPEAESEEGVVGACLLDPQIEVNAAKLENASRAESAPGALGLPAEAASFPFLGQFRHTQAERQIEFQIKGHALAEGVLLHADNCQISSVVQADGGSTSFMNCSVRNAGAQFFRLTLPKNAQLWGAYVAGLPVKPNRLQKTGDILIPVGDAQRNAPFDVGVIWSEPTGDLGMGASLALASPSLALPAQQVDWNLYLPSDYQLVAAAGNMKLLQRMPWYEEGLPGIIVQHTRGAWVSIVAFSRQLDWDAICWIAAVCGLLFLVLLAAKHKAKWFREWWRAVAAKRAESARKPLPIRALVTACLIIVGVLILAYTVMAPRFVSRLIGAENQQLGGNRSAQVQVLGPTAAQTGHRIANFGGEGEAYSRNAPAEAPHWTVNGTAETEGQGNLGNYSMAQQIGPQSNLQPSPPLAAPPPAEMAAAQVNRQPSLEEKGQINFEQLAQSSQKEMEVQKRADKAMKLAAANQTRGNYDEAARLYNESLKLQPESRQAQEQLDRVNQLAKLAPQGKPSGGGEKGGGGAGGGGGGNIGDENAPASPAAGSSGLFVPRPRGDAEAPNSSSSGATDEAAYRIKGEAGPTVLSLSALRDYSGELKKDLAEGRLDDLAEDDMQRDILSLTAGRSQRIALKSGGTVELSGDSLTISGTKSDIAEVESAASALRSRMLAKSREATAAAQREQSELAARKRQELEKRMQASLVSGGLKGGTISGSRGAGAMALDISFPSFGTRAYPFHMDYAGSSQARIELKCLHEGAALVLQALIGLVLFAGLGAAWWRSGRAGLVLAALAALALVVAWSAGGEIAKQYVATGAVGTVFSLAMLPARLLTARARARV